MEASKIIAGIYARKSILTGKGESIQNQINLCMDYAAARGWKTVVYSDEGYSGGDMDRPAFRRMLSDIDRGILKHVIFYRLDRISRKILDICEFIEQLNKKDVGFISITESFDTTSPIGRAMVHIAATFAQLEREMLAQRIKDNMLQLAKTGRWLGGVTPTGYKSKKIAYLSEELKKKHLYILEEVPEELEKITLLFDKYMELKSLGALQRYCCQNNIKSKNQKNFNAITLKSILQNPVYVKADKRAYEYFEALNIQLANPIEDFDGAHGLLSYNKNYEEKGMSNKPKPYSDWIFAIGKHRGLIDSATWIRVQEMLKGRSDRLNRSPIDTKALLSGLLFCGGCSKPMHIKHGSISKSNGKRQTYYSCSGKSIFDCAKCDCSNIKTELLDKVVLKSLLKMAANNERLQAFLKKQSRKYLKFYKLSAPELHSQIQSISSILHQADRLIDTNWCRVYLQEFFAASLEKVTWYDGRLQITLRQ